MLQYLPLVMQIGGALTGAIGSYYTAKGNQTTLRYQAEIADSNARIAELGAQSELMRGQREEQRTRLGTAQLKSRQRASIAANGIDLGSDSAVNVLTTTDVMGEIDADTVAANAVRSAWGYRMNGVNLKNETLMKRASASGINPRSEAFNTLLGSAGHVAASWYSLSNAGAFGASSNWTDPTPLKPVDGGGGFAWDG